MFNYYLKLGIRNLRRNPVLTALMVITLAVGVAASVATLTILHVMSNDPIPHKSNLLLVPVIDNAKLDDYVPGERTERQLMTYIDVANLNALKIGANRTTIISVRSAVESPNPALGLIDIGGIATTSGFFPMFEVPFKYGSAWSDADEAKSAKVLVLSEAASEKYFGNVNPVGKSIRLRQDDFQVIGVLAKWNPLPHYYNLVQGEDEFVGETEFYVPFPTAAALKMSIEGSVWCSYESPKPGIAGLMDSECVWLQYWIEAKSTGQVKQIKDELDAYTKDQHKLGRLPRQAKNELLDVQGWMEYLHVVGNDHKISTWLSFGFLALCLVNTIGLLLAKFSSRAPEVGVRRALGASKSDIFKQFIIETMVLGFVGGIIGLMLSFAGLWLISLQTKQLAVIAHMDGTMLLTTFILAISSSVFAGLLPTWRACQVTPAIQLKTQ
jgi:putative ABC transport system permease protein